MVAIAGKQCNIIAAVRTILADVFSVAKTRGRVSTSDELMDGLGVGATTGLVHDKRLLKDIGSPPTGETYKDEQALYLPGTFSSILYFVNIILKHKPDGAESTWAYEDLTTKDYPSLAKTKKQPEDEAKGAEKEHYVRKHHKGQRAKTKVDAKIHRAKNKRKEIDAQHRERGQHPKTKKGMANSFTPSVQPPKVKHFKARQGRR